MKASIGITGQMGTGKTQLVNSFAEYLKQRHLQVRIVSVDDIRRRILTTSSRHARLRAELSEHFGVPLESNGGFDLQKLAASVFGSTGGPKDFWGVAGTDILSSVRSKMRGSGVCLVEWARLVEDGFLPLVDRVIVTHCDAAVLRQRLAGGDLPAGQVKKRLGLQMNAKEIAAALKAQGVPFRMFDTTHAPGPAVSYPLFDEVFRATA